MTYTENEISVESVVYSNLNYSQLTFTCSKWTIERLENGVKYV